MPLPRAFSQHEEPTLAVAQDTVVGASGAQAQIVYPAPGGNKVHAIGGLIWSYSAAPTGGGITITDGTGNTIFQADITAAGPGFFLWIPPKHSAANSTLTISLLAPGGAILGKLNVNHWIENQDINLQ